MKYAAVTPPVRPMLHSRDRWCDDSGDSQCPVQAMADDTERLIHAVRVVAGIKAFYVHAGWMPAAQLPHPTADFMKEL
jgi:hypothetical protein